MNYIVPAISILTGVLILWRRDLCPVIVGIYLIVVGILALIGQPVTPVISK